MRTRHGILLLGAYLLVTPPSGVPPPWGDFTVGCNDPGHFSECAPLNFWKVRGRYPDEDACKKDRDARIANAPRDDVWAEYELSRCLTEERVQNGAPLKRDE
jgi:hypothetical protein